MQKQVAFESLAFELQLPSKDSGDNDRNCRQRSNQQVIVRRIREGAAPGPVRDEVKSNGRNEQRNRKMDQDHVLRVFGKYHRPDIKRVWAHPRK